VESVFAELVGDSDDEVSKLPSCRVPNELDLHKVALKNLSEKVDEMQQQLNQLFMFFETAGKAFMKITPPAHKKPKQ